MPRLSLHDVQLHYEKPIAVHTAMSGPVSALRELHLRVRYLGMTGEGGARINIEYLNGRSEDAIRRSVAENLARLSLSEDPAEDLARLDTLAPDEPVLRLMLSCALTDALATEANVSVARCLGGPEGPPRHQTNQTLFLARPADVLAEAEKLACRGFHELKLRIGAADPHEELALLAELRKRLGAQISLAADLNGAWDRPTLAAHIGAFADLGLAYLEQPLPADDLAGLCEAARTGAVPIMLDESVTTPADITRLAETGATFQVHLKLAKLGGLDRIMEAARIAQSASLPVMVGQMNEGALCTAAALAAAVACGAERAELYGADGIANDPHEGLSYIAGDVMAGPVGLGVSRREQHDE